MTKTAQHLLPRLLLAALAGFSAQAFAFQPLITDDTGTQGAGGNQLEFSYGYDRTKTAGETERTHSVPVTYTRGLTDTIDIFVGTSYTWIRPADATNKTRGITSPTIGAKWRVYENKDSKTSLAIKPEISLPTSEDREERGLGTGKTSGNLTLIVTQEVPFGAVHFNAGVGRDRFRNTEDNPNTTYKRASIAPVWDVSEQWKLALDVGVESASANGDSVVSNFVGLGAVYSPNKNVDLALGLFRTADNESPRSTTHSLTTGVTWRF